MNGDLRNGLLWAARELGIDPLDLGTAVSYETAGTFNPTIAGPVTKHGRHRGLLQWGEPQAERYLNNDFSVPSQMRGTVNYLRDAGVKPGMGLPDIYSAINAGSVGRYGASDAAAGGAPGTVMDKVNGMGGHRQKAESLFTVNLSPEAQAFVNNNPQPGGYGPGIDDPNAPVSQPATGSAGGGYSGTPFSGMPSMTAEQAKAIREALDAEKKQERRKAFWDAVGNIKPMPAAEISGRLGDARESGNMLLKALDAPTAADMLLKKRLGGYGR